MTTKKKEVELNDEEQANLDKLLNMDDETFNRLEKFLFSENDYNEEMPKNTKELVERFETLAFDFEDALIAWEENNEKASQFSKLECLLQLVVIQRLVKKEYERITEGVDMESEEMKRRLKEVDDASKKRRKRDKKRRELENLRKLREYVLANEYKLDEIDSDEEI